MIDQKTFTIPVRCLFCHKDFGLHIDKDSPAGQEFADLHYHRGLEDGAQKIVDETCSSDDHVFDQLLNAMNQPTKRLFCRKCGKTKVIL